MTKKHKKDKKKHRHKRSKTKNKDDSNHSSSPSSQSEEDSWVEAPSDAAGRQRCDNWLELPSSFVPTFSKDSLDKREKRGKYRDVKKCLSSLDQPGTHERELNPYWKDGGTGLPEEERAKADELRLPEHAVGDAGLGWLRRAYRRVKEQAEDEGRSMEEVAAERWGSLEKLQALLKEAERKAFGKCLQEEQRDPRGERQNRSRMRGCFQKPGYDDDHNERLVKCLPSYGQSSSRNWMKKNATTVSSTSEQSKEESSSEKEATPACASDFKLVQNAKADVSSSEKEATPACASDTRHQLVQNAKADVPEAPAERILTEKELNDLGAKLLKAELLGNQALVDKLKSQLDAARKAKQHGPTVQQELQHPRKETVVLTRTNQKGLTYPLKSSEESPTQRGKRKHVTHDAEGKRVKYFPDDDKYSLKELFEQEKMTTAQDQEAMFNRMAKRALGIDGDCDTDDAAFGKATARETDSRRRDHERMQAIKEHRNVSAALERCHFCLDSAHTKKHLVVSVAAKTYLCLPSRESLTEGCCLIVPMTHVSSATLLDEDVWNEVQLFRRSLTEMFQKMDQDVVFMETSMHLKRHPHMAIECVPLPLDVGSMAPIYFKKAILESEDDWAHNKQLIDLSKKDVRRSVPKGLPYFTVDFGLQGGFAHVIEDEQTFPSYFGREILGGMLDCEPRRWRKPREETFEEHKKKVLKFTQMWKQYDWTQASH